MDESTDVSDTAQLAIFFRGISQDFEITEEFASLVPMKDTTTGADLLEAVHRVLQDLTCHWPILQASLLMAPRPWLVENEEWCHC